MPPRDPPDRTPVNPDVSLVLRQARAAVALVLAACGAGSSAFKARRQVRDLVRLAERMQDALAVADAALEEAFQEWQHQLRQERPPQPPQPPQPPRRGRR